jgi:hypothetical protein
MPLPQSAVLGAKDLPRTVLSDHIEGRLFKRLREERQERATRDGKSFDEVSASLFSLSEKEVKTPGLCIEEMHTAFI